MGTVKTEIEEWIKFIGSRFLHLVIIFVLLLFSWYFTEGQEQKDFPVSFIAFIYLIILITMKRISVDRANLEKENQDLKQQLGQK